MTPAGRFVVPPDHPCLPGHFPGRPIVPGVVLLDEALVLIGGADVDIVAAKFMAVVLPGEVVEVNRSAAAGGRVDFVCRVAGKDVLRGAVRRRGAAPDPARGVAPGPHQGP